jgi:hypothetical protein
MGPGVSGMASWRKASHAACIGWAFDAIAGPHSPSAPNVLDRTFAAVPVSIGVNCTANDKQLKIIFVWSLRTRRRY